MHATPLDRLIDLIEAINAALNEGMIAPEYLLAALDDATETLAEYQSL